MVPYSQRLEAVQKLGKLFPGKVLPFGLKQRNLDYFAGIYLQTKWQKDSGQDSLPIWYLVNQSLTLAPYSFAQEYLENPNLQDDHSKTWRTYFKTGGLKDIWKSHTTNIRFALRKHREELEKTNVTASEVAFLARVD